MLGKPHVALIAALVLVACSAATVTTGDIGGPPLITSQKIAEASLEQARRLMSAHPECRRFFEETIRQAGAHSSLESLIQTTDVRLVPTELLMLGEKPREGEYLCGKAFVGKSYVFLSVECFSVVIPEDGVHFVIHEYAHAAGAVDARPAETACLGRVYSTTP